MQYLQDPALLVGAVIGAVASVVLGELVRLFVGPRLDDFQKTLQERGEKKLRKRQRQQLEQTREEFFVIHEYKLGKRSIVLETAKILFSGIAWGLTSAVALLVLLYSVEVHILYGRPRLVIDNISSAAMFVVLTYTYLKSHKTSTTLYRRQLIFRDYEGWKARFLADYQAKYEGKPHSSNLQEGPPWPV